MFARIKSKVGYLMRLVFPKNNSLKPNTDTILGFKGFMFSNSLRCNRAAYKLSVNVRVNTSCCCSGVNELKRTA